jgi:hypothetical protein
LGEQKLTNNEALTCEAAVRYLEARLESQRANIRRPEKDPTCPKDARIDYRLDIGSATLAIEHTLIEAFPSQIEDGLQFAAFVEPIQEIFKTGLPGRYGLVLEVGALAHFSFTCTRLKMTSARS